MHNSADVVIVGGGVIGASIGFYLTKVSAGRIILCEQSSPPGDGATRKSGGIIRMHHTNPYQAKLAWDSYKVFAGWNDIIGGDCGFKNVGFVQLVGEEHICSLINNVSMMKSLGIPVEVYTDTNWKKFNPYISDAGIGAAAYEPLSGYASPQMATMGFIKRAQENGLELMEGVKVSHLIVKGGRTIGVSTNIGPIFADNVILAGNTWCVDLLRKVNIEIPIHSKRISVCFVRFNVPKLTACMDDTTGTYFRPGEHDEILIGLSTKEADVNPNVIAPPSYADFRERFDRVIRRLPLLQQAKWVGGRAAFDAYTPDKHPVIGKLPQLSGVYVALGFSGGGFKVAPAVGRAIAKDITSNTSPEELESYNPGRFQSNHLITGQYQYSHM